MPTIKKTTNLAAAGAEANPLSGSQYEYLPWPAMVEIAILADGEDVDASIFSGSDLLLESAEVDQRAVTDPVRFPDDVLVEDVAAAGERLGIRLVSRAGAARIVRTVVKITRMA